MQYLSPQQVGGDVVSMSRTHPRHLMGVYRGTQSSVLPSPETEFGTLMLQALNTVNEYQHKSTEMSQKLITDPETINVHDVTLALAEANLSLAMTKSIFDRAIQAYREIVSIR